MKNLELYKNKHGLRVYCKKCDRTYNFDKLGKCSHGYESQNYKSVVYLINDSKAMHHSSKNYEEAVKAAIKFKEDVQNGVGKNFKYEYDFYSKGISLNEAANEFLRFKHGIDVPSHKIQELSKDYLKSIEFYVGQFLEVMKANGVNTKVFPALSVNDKLIGKWNDYIKKKYSRGSRNYPLRVMRLWYDWLIKKLKIKIDNPFLEVKLTTLKKNIEAISKSEFEIVCNSIGKVNPLRKLHGKVNKHKNLYRPYLVAAFKLALHTGLRREEFLTLTWNDIYQIEGTEDYMIITDNLKVERCTGKEYLKKHILVTEELKEILDELGWQSKRVSDDFILEPNRKCSVKTMMSCVTKAFSHYYETAFPGEEVKPFKILRKTYLSYMGAELGEDVIKFTSHSGTKVLKNHYFDMKIITKAKKVKIFG